MIRRLLIGVLVVFIALATVLTALLGTEPGTRWVIKQGAEQAPGDLHIDQVEGTLLRGVGLEGIRFEDDGLSLRIERLELRINAAALFGARLAITRLNLRGLDLHTWADPDPAPAEPFRMPESISLPLAIDLSPARFTDLRLTFGDAPPLVINEIRLAASVDGQSARIRTLTVDAPDFALDLTARSDLAQPYPLEAELAWKIKLPEALAESLANTQANGRIQLNGDLERLALQHQVEAPVNLRGEGELLELLTDPAWDLTHHWEAFTWHLPEQGEVHLEAGDLLSTGTLEDHRLELDTAVAPLDYPRQHIRLDARGDTQAFSELSLELAGETGRLVLSGNARWLPTPAWDLTIAGRELNPQPLSPEFPGNLDLDARLTGTLDSDGLLSLDVDALDLAGTLRGETLRLQGAAALRDTELSTPGLVLTLDSGTLSLTGTGGWAPQPHWDLRLTGDNLDPGPWLEDWPGALNLALASTGRLDPATGVEATLQLERVDGQLRDYPVSARGSARIIEGSRLSTPGLEARLGNNRLDVRGEAALDAADLHYRIDAPDLDALWPGLRGRLGGEGQLSGNWRQPDLNLQLTGTGLAYETWSLARLSLEARGSFQTDRPLNLNLALEGAAMDGQVLIENLLLTGSGHSDAHELNLTARSPEGDLGLGIRGRLTDAPGWSGRVNRLSLTETRLGSWTLEGPAALTADAERARLDPLCLIQDAARLCLEGQHDPETGLQAVLDLGNLPLERFAAFLPDNLELEGILGANARLQLRDELSLEAQARVAESRMHVLNLDGDRETIPFRDLVVDARLSNGELQSRAALSFMEQGQASAELTASPEGTTHRLDGQARADLSELRWLELFAPQVRDPRGRLLADLQLGGTLADPAFSGQLRLQDGHMAIPEAGLELEDIQIQAAAEGVDRLTVTGQVRSGPGRLELSGELGLAETGEPWAELRLTGERFQAVRLPEAQVFISPDLAMALAGREIRLTGELSVPEASIELRELPPQAVSVSRDEVIVDAEESGAPPWEIHTQVSLSLGDQVSLSGFGLSARLTGQIDVEDSPARPTRVEGEIRIVDGRYRAYGQDLTVERGVLVFQGPADNPGLDIRAVRRVPVYNVTAGLAIGGTLQDPRSRVFSTPTMEDSEAMSYLLTGRPLSGASEADANILAAAITAYGMEQGGMMTQQIGQAVGLDEFTLAAEGDLDQSALMMGKQLSSRLYARYAVGLFERTSSLMLRYTLSRNLSLETKSSGEAQSMDLIYRIER